MATPQFADASRDLHGTPLAEGVRVRVLRAAHGDRRAAGELALRLSERQSAGLDPLPAEPAAVAPALLRAHRREIRELPDDTRRLLLLAAADQYPLATHAFLRATAAAGLDTRPLDAAETAGVAWPAAGGIVFRDPWTRIAAYESAPAAERRSAHQLLARVLGGKAEAPYRAWPRAAAALGPSRRLAAQLGPAADRARRTGQHILASALVERAAD
ncbi:hypothetical protein OK074_9080, partial [Actinobacteria bacterium OK074]